MNHPTWGADAAGLICGYLIEPEADAAGVAVDSEAAGRWLAKPGNRGFVWLHFNLADAAAESWMRSHLALAFAIGASRMFLRVHFASDVIAGFASGSAWLAVCIASIELTRWYERRRV